MGVSRFAKDRNLDLHRVIWRIALPVAVRGGEQSYSEPSGLSRLKDSTRYVALGATSSHSRRGGASSVSNVISEGVVGPASFGARVKRSGTLRFISLGVSMYWLVNVN